MKHTKVSRCLLAIAVCLGEAAAAQVLPPPHEGRLHHIFANHRDADNLPQRYNSLRCALVLIQAGQRLGTGFYVNSRGDVITASHVIGDRRFVQLGPSGMQVDLQNVPFRFLMKDAKGEFQVPVEQVDKNADNWAYDLALLHTGRKTGCWLRTGDDRSARPGEHLITLGFPGLAFGSMTLYTGIMSARLKNELPIGRTIQGAPVIAPNDYIRVQMPISPGISGSPIIDDENRAIGVVTQAGAWGFDLDQLIQFQRMRDSMRNSAPTGTLDPLAALAHLASILHEYESPGYGDAVPLSYLRMAPYPSPQKPGKRGH